MLNKDVNSFEMISPEKPLKMELSKLDQKLRRPDLASQRSIAFDGKSESEY